MTPDRPPKLLRDATRSWGRAADTPDRPTLREAAQAVLDHMPQHHPGTVCLVEEELRAALAATEPGLDVERRMFVLTRLVQIAHDEMPERLNNATRVNVNHAWSYARGGYSSGLTRDLEDEYARLREEKP